MIKKYHIKDIETGATEPYFSIPFQKNLLKESLDSYLEFYLNNTLFCEVLYNSDRIIRIRYFTKEFKIIKKFHAEYFFNMKFQISLREENIDTIPLINIQYFYNEECALIRSNIEYTIDSKSYSYTFNIKKKFINGEILIYDEDKNLKYALEYNSDRKLFNCFNFKTGFNIPKDEITDINIGLMENMEISESVYKLINLIEMIE